jgi:uridine kinase
VSQSELFEEITKRLATAGKPLVISIDGRAGAGKTTLATVISETFLDCKIIHMDDLYRGWELTLGENLTRELDSILSQLVESTSIKFKKFDWEQYELGREISFKIPKILLLEGVGAGQSATSKSVDIKVWVEVSAQIGLERVLKRDGSQIENQMKLFLLEQEAHFTAEQTKERSDFHILGN